MEPSGNEEVCIFVDAGNFYHLVLKKLGVDEVDFDYEGFATLLANGRPITERGKRFYTGTVREVEGDERSKAKMSKQTSLFTRINMSGWVSKTSKLRRREEILVIDGSVSQAEALHNLGIHEIRHVKFREKGIDVQLAIDLLTGAMDDRFSTAIVVSSDTDLVPAIAEIRERFGKRVEYVGFSIDDPSGIPDRSTKPIPTLIYRTDTLRSFIDTDLRQFVLPKPTPVPSTKS
ncbi:NYN domain-containing protein [Candidatus Kaiserbacteria bacterium]|nr:NYN domain-containing protein [Candidatus Kaiserbacteria bacterium]